MPVVVQEDMSWESVVDDDGNPVAGPFVVYNVDEGGSVLGNLGFYATVEEARIVAHNAGDDVRDDTVVAPVTEEGV